MVTRSPETDNDEVWLSARTAALVLGVSPQYLGRLARAERIPAIRDGNRWRLRRRDVEIYAVARSYERRLDADHRLLLPLVGVPECAA